MTPLQQVALVLDRLLQLSQTVESLRGDTELSNLIGQVRNRVIHLAFDTEITSMMKALHDKEDSITKLMDEQERGRD